MAFSKQISIQETVNNNKIIYEFLNSILKLEIRLSKSFDPQTVCYNYKYYEGYEGRDPEHGQWYKDIYTHDYDELDSYEQGQIQLG